MAGRPFSFYTLFMGRGGSDEVLLIPARREASSEGEGDDFLQNENDFLLFDPSQSKAWMVDGEMTENALSPDFMDKSSLAGEMFDEEGIAPDVIGVIVDTAELFRFDLERMSGKEVDEITPFSNLSKKEQEEWIQYARAAYLAVAKQAFARPLAEIDDPTLMEDQGFFAVDDIRKIRGISFSPVYDASSGDRKNHPDYTVPAGQRDSNNPYMIMTSDQEWVPFDIDLAISDAYLAINGQEISRDGLPQEERQKLERLIGDMILVNKRPLKLVEGNAWHFRDDSDGGHVHKFIDPLNRIHNRWGPAIIHFNEDGDITYQRYFEDGREVRDGRPSGVHEDGSLEYWSGSWSEPSEEPGEDDFVVNIYRIDSVNGGQEWWTGDGICYRRVLSGGQEIFEESFLLGEGFGYSTTLSHQEHEKILSVLGYKPDEIKVLLQKEDSKKEAIDRLEKYRGSVQYKKAREQEAREANKEAETKREAGAKSEPQEINNLLFD